MDSLPVLSYQTFAVCGVCGTHLYVPVNETERDFHETGRCSRPQQSCAIRTPPDGPTVVATERHTQTAEGLVVERWVPLGTDPETWDYSVTTREEESTLSDPQFDQFVTWYQFQRPECFEGEPMLGAETP